MVASAHIAWLVRNLKKHIKGTSDQVMNEHLEPKISNFFVANLRNSWLLRAIGALNLNILNLNLFRPDLIRGSQDIMNVPDLGVVLDSIANHIDTKSIKFEII